MVPPQVSVLQSDFNDFYEILIKDFEIIEKFLKYYSLNEKVIVREEVELSEVQNADNFSNDNAISNIELLDTIEDNKNV